MKKETGTFENFYEHNTNIYSLEGFTPAIVDREYLAGLGIDVQASPVTYEGLERGSRVFMERLANHTVIPRQHLVLDEIVPSRSRQRSITIPAAVPP